MPNKWIEHVKQFAAKNGMSYSSAMKDQKCKDTYKKQNPMKGGMLNEVNEVNELNELNELKGKIPREIRYSYSASLVPQTESGLSLSDREKDMLQMANLEVRLAELDESSAKFKKIYKKMVEINKRLKSPMFFYDENDNYLEESDDELQVGKLDKQAFEDYNFEGKGLSKACWKGYEAIGMKKKGKKVVPNCVPVEGGTLADWFSADAWSKYAKAVTQGRKDYPPKMRDIIEKYGNVPILRMYACRTPVPSVLTSVLNVVSFGEFSKRWEKTPHDKLFHLDLRIELATRPQTTILLEKNEVLNAMVNPTPP
jgi:hypothetical protein